jgi:hypothetical protein
MTGVFKAARVELRHERFKVDDVKAVASFLQERVAVIRNAPPASNKASPTPYLRDQTPRHR